VVPACAAFVLIVLSSFLFFQKNKNTVSIKDVHALWNNTDYNGVYDLSGTLIQTQPFGNTALAYRGFAAFYLAVAEPELAKSQVYLDEAIMAMRKALYKADKRILPQLSYMLGKAYFFKNTISAYYYYADLAVHYLNQAKTKGFFARDIPEFLGLSYASLGMTKESIIAFTEALLDRDSDVLELAIAEQYYKNAQYASAKAYLFKVANSSNDDVIIKQSHALLGHICINENQFADAMNEFQIILKMDPSSSDAYYGLGVLYEKQGDYVKARAEWRRALQYDVNNQRALQKLSDSK
jgi:tetratricopeptide (TPR) repeat protein